MLCYSKKASTVDRMRIRLTLVAEYILCNYLTCLASNSTTVPSYSKCPETRYGALTRTHTHSHACANELTRYKMSIELVVIEGVIHCAITASTLAEVLTAV